MVPATFAGRRVIGIAGWKNSGKTTLATRLVSALVERGFAVATVKHAHHAFRIDDGATDSARHRRAGAGQVAIVSAERWAIVRELAGRAEPELEEMLARLEPCDIVVVEGYKRAPIAKIEVRRRAAGNVAGLADADPHVIAIAADHAIPQARVPVLDLDDIDAIVQLVLEHGGLDGGTAGSRLGPKQ